MARRVARTSLTRQRDRESRPLFSREYCHSYGRAEPRLSGWIASRAGQLQHVSGEERRVSACAGAAPGSVGKPGSYGNRVAPPRTEGTHNKIKGTHRQGKPTHRRTYRPECQNPDSNSAD